MEVSDGCCVLSQQDCHRNAWQNRHIRLVFMLIRAHSLRLRPSDFRAVALGSWGNSVLLGDAEGTLAHWDTCELSCCSANPGRHAALCKLKQH